MTANLAFQAPCEHRHKPCVNTVLMHERTVHHDMSLKFASRKHRSEVNSITYSNLTIQEHISIGPSPVIFFITNSNPKRNPSSSLPIPSGAKKPASTAGIANSGRSFVLRIPPPRRDSTSRRASRQSRPSLKTEAQPRNKIFPASPQWPPLRRRPWRRHPGPGHQCPQI